MWKEHFYHHYVYAVHEFLSESECKQFIGVAERLGFADAPITTFNGPVIRKDVRNNTRVIKDDPALASDLWRRAEPWIVTPWLGRCATGLNERFRFYRYEAGQAFAPHYDGAFQRENGERSEFTFLIYLNDDFTGGHTGFLDPIEFNVQPRTGTLLLFYHPQLHEGAVIESGTKFVLRSDVMYRAETLT